MTELPAEVLAPGPRGTPPALRSRAADLWCSHGVRWTHETAGYVPTTEDAQHPAIPCRDAGAIPGTCQPTTAYDPAEFPNAGPGAVRAVLDGD